MNGVNGVARVTRNTHNGRINRECGPQGAQHEGGTAVIGLLRGNIVVRSGDGEVIIDVAGVGYRVAVTPATAVALMAHEIILRRTVVPALPFV